MSHLNVINRRTVYTNVINIWTVGRAWYPSQTEYIIKTFLVWDLVKIYTYIYASCIWETHVLYTLYTIWILYKVKKMLMRILHEIYSRNFWNHFLFVRTTQTICATLFLFFLSFPFILKVKITIFFLFIHALYIGVPKRKSCGPK